MKSLVYSWLATVLALTTLMLLPNVTVTSPLVIFIAATVIWVVLIICWPLLKVFLLPFNLATFGLVSSFAYFLLFWFCLWIFPGVTIQPVRVFGFYLSDIAVLIVASLFLSLLQQGFSVLLERLFYKKRRK